MAYQLDRALAEAAAFVVVATAGGFTAAARAGGFRKATLTERIHSLERRLGVALLVRTTRSVRLTEEGRAYLARVQPAVEALRAGDAEAATFRSTPTGTLRVTVIPPLATVVLAEVVGPYLEACPEVSVVLDAAINVADLAREGIDVAVRIGPLANSSLVCRRLGAIAGGYYASPAYLARRGAPKTPESLQAHDAIVIPRGDRPPAWRFKRGGHESTIAVRPRVGIASFEQGITAAVAGLGIVPSPRFAVRPLLESRALVPVLEPWTPAYDVYVVYPASRVGMKTRLFVDAVASWFARHRRRFAA